jgi:cyanide hydratase
MTLVLKKYKAAAVNAEPGWFNLEESVRRTIHWIDEAGKAGCKFIAFPELCKCCLNVLRHSGGLALAN